MRTRHIFVLLMPLAFLCFGCAAELAETGVAEEAAVGAEGSAIAPEVASDFVTDGILPESFAEEVRLEKTFSGDLLSIDKNGQEYTFGEIVDESRIRIYNYNGLGERVINLPGDIYSVEGDFVRLRTGPGTSYQILGKFERNQIVLVLKQLGDWDEVKTLDGRIGFIAAAFLVAGVSQKHYKNEQAEKPKSLTQQAKDILQLGH